MEKTQLELFPLEDYKNLPTSQWEPSLISTRTKRPKKRRQTTEDDQKTMPRDKT